MDLLETLLQKRDIADKSEREHFLHPDYKRDTHDSLTLKNINTAVERVIRAMKEDVRIAIYSDYDMDGIPGAVVMNDFFKRSGYQNVKYYVPDRNREGFGLNVEAIERLAEDKVKLIITVDCGSRAVLQVAHANKLGVDVIITDHHLPGDTLPAAVAVLNPNQSGDNYPNKHLCGAGVAFKFVQALIQELQTSKFKLPISVPIGWEKWSLDMVAMATVSDMVPLIGENRALVHFGLRVLRKSSRFGIAALCEAIRTKKEYLTEDDIMFSIAPRINAASRMGHAGDALALLTAKTADVAKMQAANLEKLNKERKSAVITMVKHIKKTVTAQEIEKPVLVIGDPRWQPGLLGLAATRAVELYGKPACVWGRGDAQDVKGSCRSDGNTNIVSLLESVSDVLIDYGGHEYSGGFSVRSADVHKLDTAFSSYKPIQGINKKNNAVDATLHLSDVNWETYREIEQLAPYGVGNKKPVFEFKDIVVQEIRRFGIGKAHIEIIFKNSNAEPIHAIQFFANKELDEHFAQGENVTLYAHIEQSFFGGGAPKLRLRIVDVI